VTAIQWYPGHIAKMERQLTELLKLVDVVIEVIDSRIPLASGNPRLREKIKNKPVLRLLNKSDLADPVETKLWLKHFLKEQKETEGLQDTLLYAAHAGGSQKKIILERLLKLGETRMKALVAKGLKRRPIRVLVVGMPNVGKSSVINNIVSQKKAKTGHKAGITKQPQWVRIHPNLELLDSPGIIPPVLDTDETGMLLATVSSVGEAAFEDEEAAQFFIDQVEMNYPGHLKTYYKIPEDEALSLEAIAKHRNYIISGGQLDLKRATLAVLTDFRQGRMGRLTLERFHSVAAQESEIETEEKAEMETSSYPSLDIDTDFDLENP
jgi:ribosome biogenesis GTPase A